METVTSTMYDLELRVPTEADWDWIRPIIEQQYKRERRTRQQVTTMLSAQHGIKITQVHFIVNVSLMPTTDQREHVQEARQQVAAGQEEEKVRNGVRSKEDPAACS